MNIYTKVLPYVYRLDSLITGEFYIGYREANKEPSSIDFPKYKTSAPKIKENFDQFSWCIIAEFFNGDDAYDFEQQLIHENWNDPLLLNNTCYHGKQRFRQTEESINKLRNTAPAKCILTNKSLGRINTTDKRWVTGEIISSSVGVKRVYLERRGKTSVIEISTNKLITITTEEYLKYKNILYINPNSGIRKKNKENYSNPKSQSHKDNMKLAHVNQSESDKATRYDKVSKALKDKPKSASHTLNMSLSQIGICTVFDLLENKIVKISKSEFECLKTVRYVGLRSKLIPSQSATLNLK